MRDFKQTVSTITGLSRFKEISDRNFLLKRGDIDASIYYFENRFSLSDLTKIQLELELGLFNYTYIVFFENYKYPTSVINFLIEEYGLGLILIPDNVKQPEIDKIQIDGVTLNKMDSSVLLDYIKVLNVARYNVGVPNRDDGYTLLNNFYRDRTKLFNNYASKFSDHNLFERILLSSNNRLKVSNDFLIDDFSNLFRDNE